MYEKYSTIDTQSHSCWGGHELVYIKQQNEILVRKYSRNREKHVTEHRNVLWFKYSLFPVLAHISFKCFLRSSSLPGCHIIRCENFVSLQIQRRQRVLKRPTHWTNIVLHFNAHLKHHPQVPTTTSIVRSCLECCFSNPDEEEEE